MLNKESRSNIVNIANSIGVNKMKAMFAELQEKGSIDFQGCKISLLSEEDDILNASLKEGGGAFYINRELIESYKDNPWFSEFYNHIVNNGYLGDKGIILIDSAMDSSVIFGVFCHELGHFILNHYQCNRQYGSDFSQDAEYRVQCELEADYFAYCFLSGLEYSLYMRYIRDMASSIVELFENNESFIHGNAKALASLYKSAFVRLIGYYENEKDYKERMIACIRICDELLEA